MSRRETKKTLQNILPEDFDRGRLSEKKWDFREIALRGQGCELMDLDGSDFTQAELCFVIFHHAYLDNSDFTEAELDEVKFIGSSLCSATFFGATLNGVDFSDADLKNVDFEGADLENAILTTAKNVRGWDLRNAKNVHLAYLPPGMLADAIACGYKIPKDE